MCVVLTNKIKKQTNKKRSFFLFFSFFCCFISRIKRCMELYFHMTAPDPMQYATPHSSSSTTRSKILPWPSLSTPLERQGETCSMQSERPCKCAWDVSGTQTVLGGHSSTSDLQRDPFHVSELLVSYWFPRRTHPLLMCACLICKIPIDWTFSWTRRVLKSWTLPWISWNKK